MPTEIIACHGRVRDIMPRPVQAGPRGPGAWTTGTAGLAPRMDRWTCARRGAQTVASARRSDPAARWAALLAAEARRAAARVRREGRGGDADVTGEVFLALQRWARRGGVDDRLLPFYARRVARLAARKYDVRARQRAARQRLRLKMLAAEPSGPTDGEGTPLSHLLRGERGRMLREELKRLPLQERQAVEACFGLRSVEGGAEGLARAWGCSVATVYRRRRAGLALLARALRRRGLDELG